jgi:hypothetical protein
MDETNLGTAGFLNNPNPSPEDDAPVATGSRLIMRTPNHSSGPLLQPSDTFRTGRTGNKLASACRIERHCPKAFELCHPPL